MKIRVCAILRCANTLAKPATNSKFCGFENRLFYEKPHVLGKSFAVLRRSVGRFITIWKNKLVTQTQPTTVTLRCMHAEG